MASPRTDVDWKAVQRDYEAGLGAKNTAKKYNIHVSSVYLHAKKNDGGHKPAGGGDTSTTRRRAAAKAISNGHFAVKLTPEGLDAVWNALPAEKKAELLGNL